MGSWDGAEVCELVGLYILNEAEPKFGKDNIGLYRDDGLSSLHNTLDQKWKYLAKTYISKTVDDIRMIFSVIIARILKLIFQKRFFSCSTLSGWGGGPLFNPFLLKYCFLKLLCRENDDNWQKYF